MRIRISVVFTGLMILTACGKGVESPDVAALQQQVRDTEQAFADTMKNRDHDAFTSYLADEAIFFTGSGVLRGKQQVAEGWKAYFDGAEALFSWRPEQVEVLETGQLAHSSGPVYDSSGNTVATFNSIWRLEADGRWRVVFDKGNRACEAHEGEG